MVLFIYDFFFFFDYVTNVFYLDKFYKLSSVYGIVTLDYVNNISSLFFHFVFRFYPGGGEFLCI